MNKKFGLELSHRVATPADVPAITELMRVSIAENMASILSPEEIEAAKETMGVDWTLIEDETYFVVEARIETLEETTEEMMEEIEVEKGFEGGKVLVGCGGWGQRKTLYGGDHTAGRDDSLSDPKVDAARIRAMYTHPSWTRRGVGTYLLEVGEQAARDAGFSTIELGSTLAGEPLYVARGYREVGRDRHIGANGSENVVIRMVKEL